MFQAPSSMKAPLVRLACVIAVLAAASYAVVTFPRGVSAFIERRKDIATTEKSVETLDKENQRIEDRIRRMANDPEEQERVVKERLKYVHPDEKVYITGEPQKK